MNQDLEILKYLAKKDKQIEKLYEELIYQLSDVSTKIPQIELEDFFSFDDYPEVKEKVDDVLASYSTEQQKIITDGIKDSVKMSFASNAATLGAFTRFSAQALSDMRESVTQAFISSRMNPKEGLSLSQKVWNYTNQAKSEFEAALSELLEDGLSQGMSAEELGRMVRDKLRIPEMVYRRYHVKKLTATGKKDVIEWRRKVVDSEGKVRYIKEDLEKVGRGVYRSSRKNALRLTATEINMAYRYADNERWQREPFVIGFRIQLSGNHTLNGQPFYDICDDLVGDYPKTFRWAGWHPRCRCIATSILISKEEMMRISDLPEEEYNNYISPNLITKMPQKYGEYVDKNRDRILASMDKGTTPYWVKDNYKNGDIRKGLYWENKKGKQFKTEEQKAAIQAAWDERRRKNAIRTAAESRHANRDAVAIQKAWDERKARYAKLKSTATNVWMVALDEPWVNSTNLQFLIHRKKYHLLEDEYRKVAKEVAAVKKQKAQLSTLIPDIGTWQNLFSYDDLKAVYDSVEKTIAKINSTSLNQYKYDSLLEQKKALFEKEIKYVIDPDYLKPHAIYPTWQVAESAYANQLQKVVYQIDVNAISSLLQPIKEYTISNKNAKALSQLLFDVEKSIINQDDIAVISATYAKLEKNWNKLQKANATRQAKKVGNLSVFGEECFTAERKKNAIRFSNAQSADNYYFQNAVNAYKNGSKTFKQAAESYTQNSSSITRALRSIDGWLEYDSGYIKMNEPYIEALTDVISKSTLKNDCWIVRDERADFYALKTGGLHVNKLEKNISEYSTKLTDKYRRIYGNITPKLQQEIDKKISDYVRHEEMQLIGRTGIDPSFLSTSSHMNARFSGTGGDNKFFQPKIHLEIYCPKGVQAVYAAPYNHYNLKRTGSDGFWDGKSKPLSIHEAEIILQRGTKFRTIDAKYNPSKDIWEIKVEIIGQEVLEIERFEQVYDAINGRYGYKPVYK